MVRVSSKRNDCLACMHSFILYLLPWNNLLVCGFALVVFTYLNLGVRCYLVWPPWPYQYSFTFEQVTWKQQPHILRVRSSGVQLLCLLIHVLTLLCGSSWPIVSSTNYRVGARFRAEQMYGFECFNFFERYIDRSLVCALLYLWFQRAFDFFIWLVCASLRGCVY